MGITEFQEALEREDLSDADLLRLTDDIFKQYLDATKIDSFSLRSERLEAALVVLQDELAAREFNAATKH